MATLSNLFNRIELLGARLLGILARPIRREIPRGPRRWVGTSDVVDWPSIRRCAKENKKAKNPFLERINKINPPRGRWSHSDSSRGHLPTEQPNCDRSGILGCFDYLMVCCSNIDRQLKSLTHASLAQNPNQEPPPIAAGLLGPSGACRH